MTNQIFSKILIYLTDFSGFLKRFTGDVGSSGVHYDWLIVFFFVFVVLIVALSFGRSRMLLALLSIYVAAFIEAHFLYFDKLNQAIKNLPDYQLHIALFFLIYILVFWVINGSFLKHRLSMAEASIFIVVLVAVVEAGFLATILLTYFSKDLLKGVPPVILTYFGTEKARFWWALAPIATLLLSKRKKDS